MGIRYSVLLLSALSCSAQLQSVNIRVGGLDCASCASSVESRLKRVRGVASVKFDAEQGIAALTLAEGNRVTLDAIRDALKGVGYTPGDADVAALGTVKDDKLSLPHQPDAFVLEKPTPSGGAVKVQGKVAAGTNRLAQAP